MHKSTVCFISSGLILFALIGTIITLHVFYVLDKKIQREAMAANVNSSKCFYSIYEQIFLNQNALAQVVSTRPDSYTAAHLNALIVYDSMPGNRTGIAGKVIVPIEIYDIELEELPKTKSRFVILYSRCAGVKIHIQPLPEASDNSSMSTALPMQDATTTLPTRSEDVKDSLEKPLEPVKKHFVASISLFNFVPKGVMEHTFARTTQVWACKAELDAKFGHFDNRFCIRGKQFNCTRQTSRDTKTTVATIYIHSLALELNRMNSAYTPTNSFENTDMEHCIHNIGQEVIARS